MKLILAILLLVAVIALLIGLIVETLQFLLSVGLTVLVIVVLLFLFNRVGSRR